MSTQRKATKTPATRFFLPIPQKVTLNAIYAGVHWSKRKKLADLYHWALSPFKGTKLPDPCELRFHFTFKSRPLDCSNCSFMAKMLEDALVLTGMLKDDTVKHVRGITITSQKGLQDEVIIETIAV